MYKNLIHRKSNLDPVAANTVSIKMMVILYVMVSMYIVGIGYLYYSRVRGQLIHAINNELKLQVEFKSMGVERWCDQRIADAEILSKNSTIIKNVESIINKQTLGTPNLNADKAMNFSFINDLKRKHYKNVILSDTTGRIIYSINPSTCDIEKPIKALNRNIKKSNGVEMIDLRQGCTPNEVLLDFVAPLMNGEQVIGYWVLRVNPYYHLYPMITNWPTGYKTGETVIVRKDGENVRFISPCKFDTLGVTKLTIPLTRKEIPIIRAVMGERGINEGVDYKGKRIVSYSVQISGTNWIMETKVDEAEFFRPIHYLTWTVVIAIVLILTTLASIQIFYGWQVHKKKIKSDMNNFTDFIKTMDNVLEGCQIIDFDWNFIYINKIAEEHNKIKKEEMLGRQYLEIWPDIKESELFKSIKNCLTNRSTHQLDFNYTSSKGETRWYTVCVQPCPFGTAILTIDITEQERAIRTMQLLEKKLTTLIDPTCNGCLIMDENWRITFINDQIARYSGTTTVAMLNEKITDCYPWVEKSDIWPNLNRCMYGRIIERIDKFAIKINDQTYYFNLSIYPVFEGLMITSAEVK